MEFKLGEIKDMHAVTSLESNWTTISSQTSLTSYIQGTEEAP